MGKILRNLQKYFKDFYDTLFSSSLLNFIIEYLLIGIEYFEVYDLVFKNETERKFEIEKNQKYYFEEGK